LPGLDKVFVLSGVFGLREFVVSKVDCTLRQQLSRFRLSSHSLEIDQGPICLQTAQAVSLHSIIYSKTTRLIIRVLTV